MGGCNSACVRIGQCLACDVRCLCCMRTAVSSGASWCWGAHSLQFPAEGQGWEVARRGDLLAPGLSSGRGSQGQEVQGELNLRFTCLLILAPFSSLLPRPWGTKLIGGPCPKMKIQFSPWSQGDLVAKEIPNCLFLNGAVKY